ncbi:hypothetical protein ONE63_004931 [Megalurothrips usitatus]|uniref:trypsin n=1 Tax=Megalurothrips usitatus TaxID=439358 RepID=A0AAV7X3R3_9NEOP|nr:hypothetical protein ONE63_004931 [Megalurothrips usitatus]
MDSQIRLLWAAAAVLAVWGTPARGISGGHSTAIEKFPYLVAIEIANTGGSCVGTIVTEQWVLTSAHCVSQAKDKLEAISVRSEATTRHAGGKLHSVAAVEKHPKLNNTGPFPTYDAALLRLKDKIDTSGAAAARATLAKAGDDDPDWQHKLLVAGWGAVSEDYDGNEYPEVLMAARLPAVPRHLCELVQTKSRFLPSMLCAGVYGKDWCENDGGAPLVREDTRAVVGIASWHAFGQCSSPGSAGVAGYPAVYTKVGDKEIRKWIADKTWV